MRRYAWLVSVSPLLVVLLWATSLALASGEPQDAVASAESAQPSAAAVEAPQNERVSVAMNEPSLPLAMLGGAAPDAAAPSPRAVAPLAFGRSSIPPASQPGVGWLLTMGIALCYFGARFVRVRR